MLLVEVFDEFVKCNTIIVAESSRRQGRQLNWPCDFAELIRTFPHLNWDRVVTEATRLGVERRLHLGLFLSSCFWTTPLPQAIATNIQRTPLTNSLAQKVIVMAFDGKARISRIPYLERFTFQLRAMDRMADQARYLLRFAMSLMAQLQLQRRVRRPRIRLSIAGVAAHLSRGYAMTDLLKNIQRVVEICT